MSDDKFTVPSGFKEVGSKAFYDFMNPLDVTPRPQRSHDVWETRSREILGYSTPGYMCRGREAYYLKEASDCEVEGHADTDELSLFYGDDAGWLAERFTLGQFSTARAALASDGRA